MKTVEPRPARETEVPENERRFLVLEMDWSDFDWFSVRIDQGYLDTDNRRHSLRVRLIDDERAILTRKIGEGRNRREVNLETADLEAAHFLIKSTDQRITKRRYLRDGWEVDVFDGPLHGVVLAEFESDDPDVPVTLPPWIKKAVEVTNFLSNRELAQLSTYLRGDQPIRNLTDLIVNRRPRIVLTGGPCSGKSSMMRAFADRFGDQIHCVPEVATIVIGQVGCIPPGDDPVAMAIFQQAVYRIQRTFEVISQIQAWRAGKQLLLLDRGTGDGAAYLPNSWADLAPICRTNREYEFSQYDLVLCLEAPPRKVFEENRRNNPARHETYEQAVALGQAIERAWGDHPGYRFIAHTPPHRDGLAAKIAAAEREIEQFLKRCP
jgi:adenylate cyclase